ncbi:MAG: sigma-70 family RNA polymerase sigma factor [Firmicutes bacterium]|nr:sigma-70 family RNA polymerase sigma factor [Bacillota bacterium]
MLKNIISLFRKIFFFEIPDSVFYINSSEELPPPLPADEEFRLLSRLNDGSGTVEDRNKLIEHNLRLVVFIAKKFENTGIGTEDLASIGTIGLIKAVKSFRLDKNIKLATYASRCIENEILMYIRKTSQSRNEISIDEPLNVDWDGNELLLGDVLGSDGEEINKGIEKEEERNIILRAINQLPERDRLIVSMRFGLNGCKEQTQKAVAEYMGISQSYISRLEKRILSRLKREIAKLI